MEEDGLPRVHKENVLLVQKRKCSSCAPGRSSCTAVQEKERLPVQEDDPLLEQEEGCLLGQDKGPLKAVRVHYFSI